VTWTLSRRATYVSLGLLCPLLLSLLALPFASSAQEKKDPPAPSGSGQAPDLAEQVRLLTAKVTRLEAAVARIAPPPGGAAGTGAGGMASGGGMGMDAMMGMMMGGKGGMPGMPGPSAPGSASMGMMDEMGMGSMGGPRGMQMKMAAALPGFPGASHLYHIGATDFFLDHPEHISVTTDQQVKLNAVKQKAVTEKANAQRKVEEAEQQLWELTASDQPDAAKIEAKVRDIEKLRGDQRLAFIRAVGEAAQALTEDQRKALLGLAPAAPNPHAHPKNP
jgi:hypothetical protein